MVPPKKPTAAVRTFSDHEVIVPDNDLHKAVCKMPLVPGEVDDPVARAENALAELSTEFASWMEIECERLDKARQLIIVSGFTRANKDALFHAAHDIKGEAATFGFPAMAAAAESLCRLIEYTPATAGIPVKLVDQHVDAVRAIYREYARSDAVDLANRLTRRLREVTDDFLVRENHDRPDVLEQIMGPSIVPE